MAHDTSITPRRFHRRQICRVCVCSISAVESSCHCRGLKLVSQDASVVVIVKDKDRHRYSTYVDVVEVVKFLLSLLSSFTFRPRITCSA